MRGELQAADSQEIIANISVVLRVGEADRVGERADPVLRGADKVLINTPAAADIQKREEHSGVPQAEPGRVLRGEPLLVS